MIEAGVWREAAAVRYVYGDLFFVVNFAVNYLLLYITAYLARQQSPAPRLAVGALLGAVYALGFLKPELSLLYSLPSVLFFPALMVWVGLRPTSLGTLVGLLFIFYGVTLLVAGASLALTLLRHRVPTWPGSRVLPPFPLWGYPAVAVIALVLLGILQARLRRLERVGRTSLSVQAVLGNREVDFHVLVDSGLFLREPFSPALVVLVKAEIIQQLTAPVSPQALAEAAAAAGVLARGGSRAEAVGRELTARLRFVPYAAVGTKEGLLPGLRIDALYIGCGAQRAALPVPVTLVWTEDLQHPDFAGLIGPEIYEYLTGRERFA